MYEVPLRRAFWIIIAVTLLFNGFAALFLIAVRPFRWTFKEEELLDPIPMAVLADYSLTAISSDGLLFPLPSDPAKLSGLHSIVVGNLRAPVWGQRLNPEIVLAIKEILPFLTPLENELKPLSLCIDLRAIDKNPLQEIVLKIQANSKSPLCLVRLCRQNFPLSLSRFLSLRPLFPEDHSKTIFIADMRFSHIALYKYDSII